MKLTAIVCTAVVSAGLAIASVPAQADGDHPSPPRNVLRAMAAGIDDTVPPPSSMRTAPGELRKPPAVIKAVVVPMYWEAEPPTQAGYTLDDITRVMGETAAFYAKVSRGRQTMTSTVLPWQKVASDPCDSLSGSASAAMAKVGGAGFSMSSFNRLVVMIPQCESSSSMGQMPGKVTWIRFLPDVSVVAHELGHNLGLRHAAGLMCSYGKVRVSFGGTCLRDPYGDNWDTMGYSDGPFSVPILKRLGWAGVTATTRGSGTWTLANAENSGTGLQALRIKVSRRLSYWLEYRPDASSGLLLDGVPGVQLRRSGASKAYDIIDAAPGIDDSVWPLFPDPDLLNPNMVVGQKLRTPEGIAVEVLSSSAESAVVQVTRPFKAPAPLAPTMRGAVFANAWGVLTGFVRWDPPAPNGSLAINGYELSIDGKVHVYGPDERYAEVQDVPSTASVKMRAVSQSGPSPWTTPQGWTSPKPQLSVTSPADGDSVDAFDLTFTGTAAPDEITQHKDLGLALYVDGVANTSASAKPDWTMQAEVVEPGTHEFKVVLDDSWGGESSITRTLEVFHVDPGFSITSPTPGQTISTSTFNLTYSVDRLDRMALSQTFDVYIDPFGLATCFMDGSSGSCQLNLGFVPNGPGTMIARYVDAYGTQHQISFPIDVQRP